MASLDHPDKMVHQVQGETVDRPDHLDRLDPLETVVKLDNVESLEHQAVQVFLEDKV